jgi:hypothetical protein
MKLNKSEFKSLLKECFNNVIKEVVSKSNVSVISENKSTAPQRQQQQSQLPNGLKQVAAQAVSTFDNSETKNIFQSILEDTAATTLQTQARGEKNPMMTPAMLKENNHVENVNLEQLKPKDQPMSHWARLAFGNKK